MKNQNENLFYSNPNPIWIYDISTLQFIEVNGAAVASYGYSRAEFLTMNISQIRPEEEYQRLKHAVGNLPTTFYKSGVWKHLKKMVKFLMFLYHLIKLNLMAVLAKW